LIERDVAPWVQLPLWVPSDMAGMLAASNARALAEGLAFRPMEDTIRDTLAWDRTRGVGVLESCLPAARESELLAEWNARR
jgi:2'-hydroxyisoflavone reductase